MVEQPEQTLSDLVVCMCLCAYLCKTSDKQIRIIAKKALETSHDPITRRVSMQVLTYRKPSQVIKETYLNLLKD